MKYLLIDGNNLAIRCAFANADLKNENGIPTGVHYGVFQSLINLKEKFGDRQMLIVWDGKSKRRVQEAASGVINGVIPSGYKENRKKDEQPQPLKDFYDQAQYLQRGIGQTGIPQIRLYEYEADDVIASYCRLLRDNNDIIVVTSDKDYFQLLHDNVSLWDGMKLQSTYLKTWQEENGITPDQYVDVGAFMGDDGDNIFSVPGWGEKTALKAIKKFKSWENVLEAYKASYSKERQKYPDLNSKECDSGESKFKEISKKKSKKGRFIYPEISFNMPFSGVLYAFDKDMVSGSKSEIMALMFEERIKLAYSLKRMDDRIEDLPPIVATEFDDDKIQEYFDYYNIETLQGSIPLFNPNISAKNVGEEEVIGI